MGETFSPLPPPIPEEQMAPCASGRNRFSRILQGKKLLASGQPGASTKTGVARLAQHLTDCRGFLGPFGC